ncbi:hypothetical protein PIB30_034126 [Stylosanthes scabra]|uniref:Uncharacterized protein n=1 Tax=Stylosanthes scabra TaxID=79078 RepID=A0ABU6TEJ8_9FABA|nr:hypothetical protein [Stylosanthes scabra]
MQFRIDQGLTSATEVCPCGVFPISTLSLWHRRLAHSSLTRAPASAFAAGSEFLKLKQDFIVEESKPAVRTTAGSSTERCHMVQPVKNTEGVALTASRLTPFLSSVALRDQQLRSSAHFTPQPGHKNHLEPEEVFNMKVVDIEFFFPNSSSLLQSDDYSSLSSLLVLAPFAFHGHFQSNSNLSRPEILEQTNQGIEWNGN